MKPNPLRRLKLAFAGTLAVVILLGAAAIMTGNEILAGAALVACLLGTAVMSFCVPSPAKAAVDGTAALSEDRPGRPARRERSGISLVEMMLGMIIMSVIAIAALSAFAGMAG